MGSYSNGPMQGFFDRVRLDVSFHFDPPLVTSALNGVNPLFKRGAISVRLTHIMLEVSGSNAHTGKVFLIGLGWIRFDQSLFWHTF